MNDTIQILELFGGIGSPRCKTGHLHRSSTEEMDVIGI